MTPSLRERIQSTLNRYHAWVISLDEATDDILLAIKEALPEKKMRPCGFQDSIGEDGVPTKPTVIYATNEVQRAWNSAIEEMERILAE